MKHLSILFAIFATLLACSAFAQDAKPRPNIIVIVTDDQSPFSLKSYGNTVCQTPNLDKLAESGMVLDAAYQMGSWSGAVCLPSRTMIMTGRTVWHIPGVESFAKDVIKDKSGRVPNNIVDQTMAAVFNRAGYLTFRTCKPNNSYEAANKQFTVRHDEMKRGGTPETGSAWHGDRAVEFLDDYAKGTHDKPFLMYFGFSHPHDVRDGTPELLEKYGAYNAVEPPTLVNPKSPPLPVDYLPEHPFPNPHGHGKIRDESQVSGVMESRTEATIRNELGRYYACIENIDIQIGRVVDKLKEMGELENTYILFTSDHGIAIGGHGLQGKQNLYEHTFRVPMLVAGPGIKPGSRAPGNVYLLDILATICDFAGIDAPPTNEGKSFAPVAWGKQDAVRDAMYGVYAGGSKPGMRCVRSGDWKLIKIDAFKGELRKTQLFNLKDNPHELVIEHHAAEIIKLTGNTPKPNQRDLAEDPAFAKVRADMEKLLAQQMKAYDDPYRLWDQPE